MSDQRPAVAAANTNNEDTMNNIDNLTIAEARRLAALLAPLLGELAPDPSDQYPVGELVLVRANRAGVWAGLLASANGNVLRLEGARRIWSWTGAMDCSVLAQRGPETAKLGDISNVTLGASAEVIEVHEMTALAWAVVQGGAAWSR